MDTYTLLNSIAENIIIPIIVAFGAAILWLVKHYLDKIVKGIAVRNEISSMEKRNNIRAQLMDMISQTVQAAVASNMSVADEMKESGNKLTEDQIDQLNSSAKELIIGSLPSSLTQEDGVLLEIIGGKDTLDSLIQNLMEKYVYEYKCKYGVNNTTSEESSDDEDEEGGTYELDSYADSEELADDEPETEAEETTEEETTTPKRKLATGKVLY